MDDGEVLLGYLAHSRYISRRCYTLYGFDLSVYKTPPTNQQMRTLKERLHELLVDKQFHTVRTSHELRNMLGPEYFQWVCGRDCDAV